LDVLGQASLKIAIGFADPVSLLTESLSLLTHRLPSIGRKPVSVIRHPSNA
jgi:hypothetical protein